MGRELARERDCLDDGQRDIGASDEAEQKSSFHPRRPYYRIGGVHDLRNQGADVRHPGGPSWHWHSGVTILSTSLILDVSRRNGLTWDCVISCEMIGVYKTRPEAYRTCASGSGIGRTRSSWSPATIST